MRVVMTGADGFLGWDTRVRMRAHTDHDVLRVDVANWGYLTERVGSADDVIHFAGINRASDREVEDGNAHLARDLADSVSRALGGPAIVYANTIQAGTGTPYGTGKALRHRELFGAGHDLPGITPCTPCSVGPPEKPVAAMNPSGR